MFHILFFSFLFTSYSFSENGVDYDSNLKKTLIKVTKSDLPYFEVPASVELIKAGSFLTSAFYECRSTMDTIIFAPGSQLKSIEDFLFAYTRVKTVDMSSCTLLKTLPLCTFYSSYLESINLPPKLETIGKAAIANTNIKKLVIPASVTKIDDYHNQYGGSIGNNKQLTEVTFENGSKLNYIGKHCFMNDAIQEFTFPQYITEKSIIGAPFFQANVTKFNIDGNENGLSLDDHHWTLLNGTKIILVVTGVTDVYTISSSITSIADQAFRSSQFKQIKFEFQTNLTFLPYLCFSSCHFTSFEIPEGIESINSECFTSHKYLENITLPSTLQTIEYGAFQDCISLKNFEFPTNLRRINNNTFSGCKNLTYLFIPKNVTYFGTSVFSNCSPELNITFEDEDKFSYDDGMLFEGQTLKDYFGNDQNANLTIPNFCTVIPENLFKSKGLKSITFNSDSSCTKFEKYAFYQSLITSITLPPMLETIGIECFYQCKNLIEISFSHTQIHLIPRQCFYQCSRLQKVIFDNSNVNEIDYRAFYDNIMLSNVDLDQSSIEKFGTESFYNTNINIISFPASINESGQSFFAYTQAISVTFDAEATIHSLQTFCFANSPKLETVVICDSIITIGDHCFENCPRLVNFTLGRNTSTIGQMAFQNCKSLKTLIIPNGSNLTKIMPFAFSGCTSFDTIDLQDNSNFIFEDNILMDNTKSDLIYYLPGSKEKTLLLSSTIKVIKDYAFYSCTNLYEVFIPIGNLEQIGYQSFMNCSHLTRLYIPKGVKIINDDAFKGCNNLKCGCVNIPDEFLENITKIGIQDYLVSDYCKNTDCYISFDKITCNSKPMLCYSTMLFIILGTSNSF